MADYIMHTPESAPEAVRHILAGAQQKLGFVPNLYAGMANAPATLQAYLALSGFVEQTSLSPTDRHVIYLTASEVNGCEFCVAAHSMLAKKMAGVPEDVVVALRAGRLPSDPRLAALAAFTRAVVEKRGWVADDPTFDQFLNVGFTQQQALEVILVVAQKTLSNYANHLLKTPVNMAFASEQWSRSNSV